MRSLIWRGANQRGLWIQLTHEFSEVKGQLAHHQEQTKKTTGLSGALKGPKKRGRAKKKIRTKNPQTFWLKTAICFFCSFFFFFLSLFSMKRKSYARQPDLFHERILDDNLAPTDSLLIQYFFFC